MMKKNHYYDLSVNEIKNLATKTTKPTILLHVCCAPCSCFPLLFLAPHFDITIYYNNSNIYPRNEYDKRKNELKRYLEILHKNDNIIIPMIEPDYLESFQNDLAVFANEPENGKRCQLCYHLRMDEAFQYASENNFDYFCTIMTISRQKDSVILNQIGEKLTKKYPNTKYFYSDFKKKDGTTQGNAICKQNNLYCQRYCGCKYSMENEKDQD
jgi:Uncharacterized protein conserved in bacteria